MKAHVEKFVTECIERACDLIDSGTGDKYAIHCLGILAGHASRADREYWDLIVVASRCRNLEDANDLMRLLGRDPIKPVSGASRS